VRPSSESSSDNPERPDHFQPENLTPQEKVEAPVEPEVQAHSVEARAEEVRGAEDVREVDGREPLNQRAAQRGTFLADHRGEQPEYERRPISGTQKRVLAFTWIGVFMMLLYGAFKMLSFHKPGYRPID
jgi:hypothetical protein